MRASTPRLESRSEGTLDCHTDALLLKEAAGAVDSTYLRGSAGAIRGRPHAAPVARRGRPARSVVADGPKSGTLEHAKQERGASAVTSAGGFALGATAAASIGHVSGRALETAVASCVLAGLVLLLVVALRTRVWPRPRRKRRAEGGRD